MVIALIIIQHGDLNNDNNNNNHDNDNNDNQGPPEYGWSCDYSEQVTIIAYYSL